MRIISDNWAAYNQIEGLSQGAYLHGTVNHTYNFVDPNDPTLHTNRVENMWMRAKRKLRKQFGTSENLFGGYLFRIYVAKQISRLQSSV